MPKGSPEILNFAPALPRISKNRRQPIFAVFCCSRQPCNLQVSDLEVQRSSSRSGLPRVCGTSDVWKVVYYTNKSRNKNMQAYVHVMGVMAVLADVFPLHFIVGHDDLAVFVLIMLIFVS